MVYQTLPAEKMKKKIVKNFFRFSLAVIAIENDDEGRKQNFSISPMGGVFRSVSVNQRFIHEFISSVSLWFIE